MKINLLQLANHLAQKSLVPIYIISNEDPMQMLEAKNMISAKAKDKGFIEKQIFYIDKEFKWEAFINDAYHASLFASNKLIELRITNLNQQTTKVLTDYAKNIPKQNILLIIIEKITMAISNAAWFKLVEKQGVYINISPISSEELPNWIINRFTLDNFKISHNGAYILADKVEGDLVAAAQEVEKLKLLATDKTITDELVSQSVTDCAKFDAYKLAAKAIAGDLNYALRILKNLQASGAEPTIILWSLTREIRLLSHLSRLTANNVPQVAMQTQLASIAGVPLFIIKRDFHILKAACKRHSEANIRKMLLLAATTDQAIKGINSANVWLLLITLVEKLCGYDIVN